MNKLKTNSISLSQRASIGLIRGYQYLRPTLDRMAISVFGTASQCKSVPTCSQYTIEAIRRRGTIAGVIAGLVRILNCR